MFTITSLKKRTDAETLYIVWSFIVLLGFITALLYFSEPKEAKTTANTQTLVLFLLLLVCVVTVSVWRYIHILNWLKKRSKNLAEFALQHNLAQPHFGTNEFMHVPATMIELGMRDRHFLNAYTNGEWTYGDYTYSVYQKSKYGEHKTHTVHYAVCYIQLPRQLPHLFFDAKQTKGREFKKRFDDSQRHSLEGNFDTYFDTYFPPYYTLDSLSFITPEVMQALIDAKYYDIEIVRDKLYLYGRLQPMPQQIASMTTAANAIKKALLNNILTYRDQRVAYENGRKDVSIYGQELRKSIVNDYIIAVLGIVIFAAGVAAAVFDPSSFQMAAILVAVGGGMFVVAQGVIVKERAWRRNAKFMHQAQAHKKIGT